MTLFNNTVESITASLAKQVTLLRELAQRESVKAASDEAAAKDLADKAAARRTEASKAENVANKINALLSAD